MFEYKKIKKESRMDIQVSGKQLKIGKSLTDYAKEHLDIINKKYLLRPTFANITFTKFAINADM